jgi:hypothetical protein
MTEHPMQPPPQLLIRHRGFATTWEDALHADRQQIQQLERLQ